MRRRSVWVSAAMTAAGLAGPCGCSLISLDALDPPGPDASTQPNGSDSSDEETESAEADDTVEAASDDSAETAGDSAESGDDAGEDGDAGNDGDAGGDASDGTLAPDDAMANEGGDDATNDGSAETGDGHKCGSVVLAPKTAVASSAQPASAGNVALPAILAIDNDFTTRWGSALQVDPSWIYMDLGKPAYVSEVDLIWQNACATAFTIEISADAAHWTVMKTVTGNNVGVATPPTMAWNSAQVLRYAGLSGRGRYVRVNGTARCLAMYGYSIWEMRASGDTDANCSP